MPAAAAPSPLVITPKDWGPLMWHTLFIVAIAMPVDPTKEEQRAFVEHVAALEHILPCITCRIEFTKILAASPPRKAAKGGRDAMVNWVLDAFNSVRARQNKPPLDMADVQQMIVNNHKKQQAAVPLTPAVLVSIVGLIVLVVGGAFYMRSK